MSSSSNRIYVLLGKLWVHLNRRRKIQFHFILCLAVIASIVEIFSIGAVFPFLSVMVNPDSLYDNNHIQEILKLAGLQSREDLKMLVAIIFLIASLISGSLRLFQSWIIYRFSYGVGSDLSVKVYRNTLYQPYIVHVSRNSSEIINGISVKCAELIAYGLNPIFSIFSSFLLMTAILITMLVIDPIVASTLFFILGISYFTIMLMVKTRLGKNSILIADNSNQVVKAIQEGLGGIRDVIISGSQELYCQKFNNSVRDLRLTQSNNMFVSGAPRFVIETISLITIAIIAFIMIQSPGGLENAIPTLGAFALGAVRIIPPLQLLFSSWSKLKGNQASINDIVEMLDLKIANNGNKITSLPFNSYIELRNINYTYNNLRPAVIKDVNLKIKKGSRIGFIGTTGSGKSTLINIIMGLLVPTKGEFLIDGISADSTIIKAWQNQLAHVPQMIYLTDNSIEENIAFGVPQSDINHKRVQWAAKQAQLDEIIKSWPLHYKTVVGERGVQLSGGQRQRVGIARAIYKKSDVIIFDEATSALDSDTESDVINAIEGLDKNLTILLIAHRVSTLKNCDTIVNIEDGKITQCGSFEKLIKTNI